MADWEKIDAYLHAAGIRIDVPNLEQTTGGKHVSDSEHYQGRARDYGVWDSDAPGVCRAMLPYAHGPNYIVDELFFTPMDVFYKNGEITKLDTVETAIHMNHCHVGIRAGANFPGAPQPPQQPQVQPRRSNLLTSDPISGGYWETDETGAVFAKGGAPYLGGLNSHPDWHAGNAGAPVIGICFWKGDGTDSKGNGYVIATRPPGSNQPNDYCFPRNGSLAK